MKIIAEVGSNWFSPDQTPHQRYFDLKACITCAKEDGADAVKFQKLSGRELYGRDVYALDRLSLTMDELRELKGYADEIEIEFMCSAFSIEGYKSVDTVVQTHKIASSEANWFDLIDRVLHMNKSTIISTGGLNRFEIAYLVDLWKQKLGDKATYSCPGLTLLYCDPTYPSEKTMFHVMKGLDILDLYGVNIGYSDHTLEFKHDIHLLERISVIEKHYNPLRNMMTPDSGHSLGRTEFKMMVDRCRTVVSYRTENIHRRRLIDGKMLRPYFGK